MNDGAHLNEPAPGSEELDSAPEIPLEEAERRKPLVHDWEQHFTAQQAHLRALLKRARITPDLRDKRQQLTATALNSVLELARVTRARSVMSNFLSGSQDLSPMQLKVLVRELIRLDVLTVTEALEADHTPSSPKAPDPVYAATLTTLSRALTGFLDSPDHVADELRRWDGQFYLLRRSFFAPTYFCLAHVQFTYDELSQSLSVIETNGHTSSHEGTQLNPPTPDLVEHYDGVLVIERQGIALMITCERMEDGKARGAARVAMLDRFVHNAEGKVVWAKGRMLISGSESEPIVMYRPDERALPEAPAMQSRLLQKDEVDPILLAQLGTEISRSAPKA
jgi:hypothetical protein